MNKLQICILALFLVAASVKDARKANEAYREGDYATAIELYKKAIEDDPKNPKLYFNLGNALAKDGRTEEAIRYYEQFKTMTDNAEQRALADYNIGNVYAQAKDWGRAANHYRKALQQDNTDLDAKYNYELARRKQQEQQKQNQQQQQEKQKNKQQNQQDQQNSKQNQQQQNQQNNRQQQNQPEKNQQKQQRGPNRISKAEAERILQALEQKEKELLKEFKKQKTESSKNTNEKDW